MVTQEATHLDVDPSRIGRLELEGLEVPYVNLEDQPFVHIRLRFGDTEYGYSRGYPVKSHSAVMPVAGGELREEDHQVLVAERGGRYYVYLI